MSLTIENLTFREYDNLHHIAHLYGDTIVEDALNWAMDSDWGRHKSTLPEVVNGLWIDVVNDTLQGAPSFETAELWLEILFKIAYGPGHQMISPRIVKRMMHSSLLGF
jgi:hypothetical protein